MPDEVDGGGVLGAVHIYERGLTWRGPVPAYQRSDAMRERETDPEAIMRNWGTLTTEVASVVTPIRLLMRSAAATDPEMAALLEASDDERLDRSSAAGPCHGSQGSSPTS